MRDDSAGAVEAARRPRIAIEALSPTVDAGRFPVKTIVGRPLTVEADIFADGHDMLLADVLWRGPDDQEFRRAPMKLVANDRWRAVLTPEAIGRHEIVVEAWWDEFGTFRRDLTKKREVGLDVMLETEEGLILLEKLAIFPDEIRARNQIAQRYNEALAPHVAAVPTVADGPSPPLSGMNQFGRSHTNTSTSTATSAKNSSARRGSHAARVGSGSSCVMNG